MNESLVHTYHQFKPVHTYRESHLSAVPIAIQKVGAAADIYQKDL